jgi:hypothetical protein
MSEVKCCNMCKFCRIEGPYPDQPYPESWCGKGVWEGGPLDDLCDPIDCEFYERKEGDRGWLG